MKRQKKVALFISHIFGDYQKDLCNGVIKKASEFGYYVDIFVTNDGESFDDLGLGEDGILDIPKFEEYRGIIVASGTYVIEDLKDKILEKIKNKCNCPVIDVTQDNSELYNILIDNYNPMKELVNHLISVHKYEHLCFIAYKGEQIFSTQRLDAYKEVLTEYNLQVKDENICWSDYSVDSAREAVEHFIGDGSKLPDAIICYNDTIALNVAGVLKEKGFHIPTDIAITGYDDSEFAQNNNPPITSIAFPVFEMGVKAMDNILQIIAGKPPKKTTIIPTHPIIRGSCGCVNDNCKIDSNYNLKLINRISQREKSSILDMNMASSLLNITDIDDGMEVLEKFTNVIDNLEGLYICLYPNWDSLPSNIREITNYEEIEDLDEDIIQLKFGIKNNKRVPECSFNSKMLLPEYIYHNSSSAYLYMPLYFKDKKFGYLALSYRDNLISYDFSFMSWIRNINNMLQLICSNNELNTLVNKLDELYLRDELTNLYNLRGFLRRSENILKIAYAERSNIMIASFTLKNYQMIIEDFGHLEGDFAIKVVARALESSIDDTIICGRTGVDEFIISTMNYDNKKASLFLDKINKYLENYNILYPKKYKIETTSDFYLVFPDKHTDFETLYHNVISN